jgi:DNA primase
MTGVFEDVRERVSMAEIIGVDEGRKTHCVAQDHTDADPSMHNFGDHVHCFSCQFHADVTDVWAAMHGFDQPVEAALDLARKFGIALPEADPETHRKAQERRKKEELYLMQARACHRALQKHPNVREWWESRGFSEALRERFLLGTNKDGTVAVIPFFHRGRVQGLIRRKLEGGPKYLYPNAEDFPQGHRPLFIPGPLRSRAYLVEDILDALAVVAAGESAIAIGGTAISEPQMRELRSIQPQDSRLYILPDGHARGAEAARTWARQLFPKALLCKPDYGTDGKDVADLFARANEAEVVEHLERLKGGAQDLIDIETDAVAEMEASIRAKLAYATERIVPLLVRVSPESLRDATADIIAGRVEGLKVGWLRKAIKEDLERQEDEALHALRRALAEEQERRAEEHRQKVEEAQGDIDALFGPGVLKRLRKDAAKMHNVRRDERPLELVLLTALGAQLAPLPNGRPLGTSELLTGDAGRGKNHLADAAVKPLPEEFYLTFEIASGQYLYYAAADNPSFLKHRFVYPNEIEGVEALIEFLRPMLSKGSARKFVTNKDSDGRNVIQEIIVEGPVTTTIPTVRNKTDEQLQTRLLVAELPDYVGRVKEHSKAVSDLLHPTYTTADYSYRLFLWHEGFRQLTNVRRVVLRLDHPNFALDDDKISHGARIWANLLGLMATHAWIEQRNRKVVELPSGESAIEATPDDYEVAYNIFTAVCQRSVVNLSENHRKILDSLYDLHAEFPNGEGFAQREIASGAGVSPQTVSNNKTFLATSAKLIKETNAGLALVEGADPSWWSTDELSTGLPTPEKVRSWWEDGPPDPPSGGSGHAGNAGQTSGTDLKPPTYEENSAQSRVGQRLDTSNSPGSGTGHPAEFSGRVQPPSGEGMDSENGLDKRNNGDEGESSSASSVSSMGASTYTRASENPALIADGDDGVNV